VALYSTFGGDSRV